MIIINKKIVFYFNNLLFAQSAGAVKYIDYISVEG